MRQPVRLVSSDRERLTALEDKAERWEKMETKVDEIHTLLVQAKGVLWLGTKITGGIGTVGVVIGILKYFSGH